MGKKLIITEKPSVAQDYAKVFSVSGRNNGYIENDKYVITWCVGHLVEMVYPEQYDIKYKKWTLEDLPFLPEKYKYDIIPSVKQQYEIVHNLLHRKDIDTVYWAGDSGKEGQTIEENIRNFGGVREGMQELRVWIDSQTEEEIRRGVAEAKPMSDYANLGFSGIMRSIEDYAMGINFSRVMSVKYGKLLNDAAATKEYTAIAIGRVMTCVLGMVVNREREIRNFKETPFYRVIGNFTEGNIEAEWKAVERTKYYESPKLYKENGFKEKHDAEELINSFEGQTAEIKSIEKGTTKKKAPLLFNLAELQAECSKKFKISPDETLQIAQELYEKKLTTYPRTDARVLSSAVAKEIQKTIFKLKDYEPVKPFVGQIINNNSYSNIAKTHYTDDSKITDHYAIIPTGQLTELSGLSDLQKKVFDLIVRRFLSIFYPPAEYKTLKLIIEVSGENLFANAKLLSVLGYLEIMGKTLDSLNDDEDISNSENSNSEKTDDNNSEDNYAVKKKNALKLLQIADTLKQGDCICVNGYEIKDSKTSPPKHYTSGSIILAMENAGQLIEDEELRAQIKGSGIGTSATRAEIIRKLIRIGYLNLNKRTQVISTEAFGEMIYEVVVMTVPALLNPKMTASWEKGLDGITQGTVDMSEYRKKLEAFIRKETINIRDNNLTQAIASRISSFTGKNARGLGARRKIGAKCPICNSDIITTPFGYGCSNYSKDNPDSCRFSIGKICENELAEDQVVKLLTEGHTDTIHGFKSKAGKKFDAIVKLDKNETNKVIGLKFDFENLEQQNLQDAVCPNCGGSISKTPFGYGCTNYNKEDPNSCRFSIGKICEKDIPESQVKLLLKNGRTDTIRGFKSKNGKKFDAIVTFDKDINGKVIGLKFDFDNVEQQILKDVSCPNCNGNIVKTSFGYGCENYNKNDPESCRFSIGKICERDIPESQIKLLLKNGITDTIRGFKSKSGKKFDARLIFNKDNNGKVTGISFSFDDLEKPKLKDVICPLCGGDIVKTIFGYGCSNYNKDNAEKSCHFSINSKISGVKINDSIVKQLLTLSKTDTLTGFVSKNGKSFDAPLKLTRDGKVEFDFGERPEPEKTQLVCPKCKETNLLKTQWYYECTCGFKIGHTVAQVCLSEDVMNELFTSGKTVHKIKGFVSKAGNTFDTCLKYEDEKIIFDFDNPGEKNQEIPNINSKDKSLELNLSDTSHVIENSYDLDKSQHIDTINNEKTAADNSTEFHQTDEFDYLMQMATESIEFENSLEQEAMFSFENLFEN